MKQFSVSELISKLMLVRWSTTSSTSTMFNDLKIRHGFIGTSADPSSTPPTAHHVQQIHGIDIVKASSVTAPSISNSETAERPAADGLYSLDGTCIAVKTADCLPVLIASANGEFTQAIHAGWRGLTAGILAKGVNLTRDFYPINQCRFAIGPAVSREAFEVGPEIVTALQSDACALKFGAWALPVSKGRSDRWHVDLSLAAALQLMIAGAEPQHIEIIRACTVNDQNSGQFLWNSFRRQGKGCQSNWSWIQGA